MDKFFNNKMQYGIPGAAIAKPLSLGIGLPPSAVILKKEDIFEAAKRSVCHLFGTYTYKEKEEKIDQRLNDTCSKEKDSCKSREELKQKIT